MFELRRLKFAVVALLVLVGSLTPWSTVFAVHGRNPEYTPRQIIVKFKDGTSAETVEREISRHRGKVRERLSGLDTIVVEVPDTTERRAVAALSRHPDVEYAELDYQAEALGAPNDPNFATKQWGLENTGQIIVGATGIVDADIDASSAWETTLGSVAIAVLDSGIDQDHIDLSSKIILERNFTSSSTADDLYGHGTHVAGIAAAATNNGVGVAGGCPNCQLINGKVLGDNGYGAYSWVANGIIWATDSGAKVINLSLGGPQRSTTLERAVKYAVNHGAVVVAAAGNSGNKSKTYPAAYSPVIAVAATNNRDQKASFSSYGAGWVDIAAPGEQIFSTFPNHTYAINKSLGYDFGSGTSMATPMVSAVAALVWSTPYGTSNSAVRARVEFTADRISGTGSYWAKGRVNAASAVAP